MMILLSIALGLTAVGYTGAAAPPRLLVVTVTKGYRHASIPTAEAVLRKLADSSKAFVLDHARTDAELAEKTVPEALKGYGGVVFASTTGELPIPRPESFLGWIEAGHAFVGIHSATDTLHGSPPYVAMIGGEFASHGEQARVELLVQDPAHPATRDLAKGEDVLETEWFQRHLLAGAEFKLFQAP